MYQNRNYCVFSMNELEKIDFTQVCETSADTVRKSLDGTLTFVKWDGEEPICVSTLTTIVGTYTHDQILEILSGPEWSSPELLETTSETE